MSDAPHHIISASLLGITGAAVANALPQILGVLGAFLAVIWYTFEIIDNPAFKRLWAKITGQKVAVDGTGQVTTVPAVSVQANGALAPSSKVYQPEPPKGPNPQPPPAPAGH